MAEKKKKKDDGVLVNAAEAVGAAIGKVAALAGVAGEKPKTPPTNIKIPKLAKSDKHHLPRKLKKAQKKAAEAASRR